MSSLCWTPREELMDAGEQALCFGLVLPIFGRPVSAPWRIEDVLQLGAGFGAAPLIHEHFGQKVAANGAVFVVCQRRTQVFFGALVTAAEHAWDLEIPSSERPVSRTLHERGIDAQHSLELLLD